MSGDALGLAGILLTSAGAALGMAGSFLMAHAYHPFSFFSFLGHLLSLAARLAMFDLRGFREEIRTTLEVSAAKSVNRAKLLGGLYLVFLAFLISLAGGWMSYFAGRPD